MMTDSGKSGREDALRQIARLAHLHGLTPDDVGAAMSVTPSTASQAPQKSSALLNRLFLYLGGLFIFAGLCALAHVLWDDLSSAQRVLISLGSGVVALLMGLLSLRDLRFEKASTAFFLASAALQPTGLFVFLYEYFPNGGDPQLAALAIFVIMSLQNLVCFWQTKRTSLLFFALLFSYGSLGILFNRIDIPTDMGLTIIGISMICVARHIQRTIHASLSWVGYFVGALSLLTGYFDFVEGTPLELTFLALNTFLIYLSLSFSSRALLFVSVGGLLCYIAWYTSEYFSGIVGWPIALIFLGFVFLGIGAMTIRLSRRIRSS